MIVALTSSGTPATSKLSRYALWSTPIGSLSPPPSCARACRSFMCEYVSDGNIRFAITMITTAAKAANAMYVTISATGYCSSAEASLPLNMFKLRHVSICLIPLTYSS